MKVGDPHYERHVAILRSHPEIRQLFSTDWTTVFYGVGIVVLHLVLAFLSRERYWYTSALLGVSMGAFLDLGLMVLMHETSHHLVFKTPMFNILLGLFCNIPLLLPMSITFNQHHKEHHLSLGSHDTDVDVPLDYEVTLVGTSPTRKFIWLLFAGIILAARSTYKLGVRVDKYLVLNWITCITFGLAALVLAPSAAAYLIASSICSLSFHPANARIVQRHVPPKDSTTGERTSSSTNTYSFYGWSNILLLNVGYHVEHHDFPRVPWRKLPLVKEIAKEFYTDPPHLSRGFSDLLTFVVDSSSLGLYSNQAVAVLLEPTKLEPKK